ncbi:MAG: CPBP family intramembrane glutamic endopeptidase [Simkaniaceae bacterium]
MKKLLILSCAVSLTLPSSLFPDMEIPEELSIQQPTLSYEEPMIREDSIGDSPFELMKPEKSTFLTVGLSALYPGLGHAYLGEMGEASMLAGSYTSGVVAMQQLSLSQDGYIGAFEAAMTAWSYGMYASYRDVRNYNENRIYTYDMPQDSFAGISLASVNPKILKKFEVWGGVVGALIAGATITNLSFSDKATALTCSSTNNIHPLFAFPTGISEEAFFRGFLQSSISEISNNPVIGIIGSSLLFGAAHIANAGALEPEYRTRYYTVSLPFITALGAYFGLLTYKNKSLKEAVAVHAWYDFVLFLASRAVTEAKINHRPVTYQISFDF